ncbi:MULTISPECIES: hypothetical protein [Cupriavidus]
MSDAQEAREMRGWQSTYLGAREVPRELSCFELQTFFKRFTSRVPPRQRD